MGERLPEALAREAVAQALAVEVLGELDDAFFGRPTATSVLAATAGGASIGRGGSIRPAKVRTLSAYTYIHGVERHHHRSHSIPTQDATRCAGRTGARQSRVTRWTCSAHLIDALVLAWCASPPPRLVSALRVDSAEGRASAAVKCGTSSAVAEASCDQVTRGTSRRTLIEAASRERQLS